MTNTLTKIASLKLKMDKKSELCTLLVNNWLQEYDPEKEPGKFLAFRDALKEYKKMGKELTELEGMAKLGLVEGE